MLLLPRPHYLLLSDFMPINCLLAGKEVQEEGQTGCQRDQDSGYRWQRTRGRYTIISHIIEIIVLVLCYLVMKDS